MDQYINLMSLAFNVSWIPVFMWAQVIRGAYKHYMFPVEGVTLLMLLYELYRELIILTWHVETQVTPLRVYLYGLEHVFLGLVIREGLYYVERYKKDRKRSRHIR